MSTFLAHHDDFDVIEDPARIYETDGSWRPRLSPEEIAHQKALGARIGVVVDDDGYWTLGGSR